MNSLILSTATRLIVLLMEVFALFLLLRGHNLPGGGFVGGLVASCAFALLAISDGSAAVRRTLPVDPRTITLVGLAVALIAGFLAMLGPAPFLTGVWTEFAGIPLGTPLLFDVGVFLMVFGAVLTLMLALEEEG